MSNSTIELLLSVLRAFFIGLLISMSTTLVSMASFMRIFRHRLIVTIRPSRIDVRFLCRLWVDDVCRRWRRTYMVSSSESIEDFASRILAGRLAIGDRLALGYLPAASEPSDGIEGVKDDCRSSIGPSLSLSRSRTRIGQGWLTMKGPLVGTDYRGANSSVSSLFA